MCSIETHFLSYKPNLPSLRLTACMKKAAPLMREPLSFSFEILRMDSMSCLYVETI